MIQLGGRELAAFSVRFYKVAQNIQQENSESLNVLQI
jgi:hypothetical protein